MTIQEAIKSGKPFRRKTWGKRWPKGWYVYPHSKRKKNSEYFSFTENSLNRKLVRDVLATDWEVKPPPVREGKPEQPEKDRP